MTVINSAYEYVYNFRHLKLGETAKPAMVVTLHCQHNHPLKSAAVLGYRPVSEETKLKLCQYFEEGTHPYDAMCLLRQEITGSDMPAHEKMLRQADSSLVPCYAAVYW